MLVEGRRIFRIVLTQAGFPNFAITFVWHDAQNNLAKTSDCIFLSRKGGF